MTQFRTQFAEDIFHHKYAHEGCETWHRLSETLIEDVCQDWLSPGDKADLIHLHSEMKFIAGGRYLYYAGRKKRFYNNCFLMKAEEDSREDWANLSWKAESALLTGGGIGIDYCLAPDTKILKADLTWSNISNLQVGDDLVGFDEGLDLRKGLVKKSIVTSIGKATLPCYKIVTDQGEVTASAKHKWVSRAKTHPKKKGEGYQWKTTDELVVGHHLAFTIAPWEVDKTYNGGYISGIFDGEGWVSIYENSKLLMGCAQKEGKTLDKIKNILKEKSINFNESKNGNGIVCINPSGRWESYKVLGMFRPERLLKKVFDKGIWGSKARGKHTPPATILEVKYIGEQEVITIGTSTKTLIANGFLSHNSIYRPKNTPLKGTGGVASGPISKMMMINEIGRFVQQGGARRSAIFGSLNWQHADAIELMYSKDWDKMVVPNAYFLDNGPVTIASLKAKDFNFWAPLDMTNISLNYDDEFLVQLETLQDLPDTFVQNIRQAMKTGEPGMSFNFNSKGNETLRNACTEVTSEDDSDVCNLASINMSQFDNVVDFKDAIELATKFLICGTLRGDLPYEKVYKIRDKNRRLGLGLMGVHEWLLKRDYKYEVVNELRDWLHVYERISKNTARRFSDDLEISTPIACRAIAPTGTIGIMACTSTGIEPLFATAYKRRYLTTGNSWHFQLVVDGTAKHLIEHYGIKAEDIETALDLAKEPERRIKFQADVQDYVDMGISSTINLERWESTWNNESLVVPFAETIAKYAHRLRGLTMYPDSARDGQPLTPVPYDIALEHEGEEYEEKFLDVCEYTNSGSCGT